MGQLGYRPRDRVGVNEAATSRTRGAGRRGSPEHGKVHSDPGFTVLHALMHFAQRLRPHWRGIVSRVCWPMHTGQLESINNRIKVIKRMAYGYRDSTYFFLKIRAAFPGNP